MEMIIQMLKVLHDLDIECFAVFTFFGVLNLVVQNNKNKIQAILFILENALKQNLLNYYC